MVSELVETMVVNASVAKYDVVKFDGTGNFGLWLRRVKDLLVQQGLVKSLYGKMKKPKKMKDDEWDEGGKYHSTLSGRRGYAPHHGRRLTRRNLDKIGELVHVDVTYKHALS